MLLYCLHHHQLLTLAYVFPGIEVPDGSYMLVPADENEGAGGDVHYVTIDQDPDQSPEVCVSACADEGKPRFKH